MNLTVAIELDVDSQDIESIASFAKQNQSDVTLVHIVSPQPVLTGAEYGGLVAPILPDTEPAETELNKTAEVLRAYGLVVRTVVEIGSPVHGIIAAAQAADASMILVIAKHHNLVHRAIAGSVVSGVVKSSPLPVLVLPHRETGNSAFDSAVDRLFHVAERQSEDVDMTETEDAISAHRADPASEEHRFALHGALHRLQQKHPDLFAAANDLYFELSFLGV